MPQSEISEENKLPCGVPGYDMSAAEYAALIQYHINLGHFFLAHHYMEMAKRANMLQRIEQAAVQFFDIQPT